MRSLRIFILFNILIAGSKVNAEQGRQGRGALVLASVNVVNHQEKSTTILKISSHDLMGKSKDLYLPSNDASLINTCIEKATMSILDAGKFTYAGEFKNNRFHVKECGYLKE